MPAMPPVGWPGIDTIQATVTLFQSTPDAYRGAELLPVEEQKYRNNPSLIKWDVVLPISGMTKAHNLGNSVARVEIPKLRTMVEETMHFREKITLNEQDLMNLRNLGPNDRTRMAGMIVTKAMNTLRLRLAQRKEWCRWEANRGSLVISENGVERIVTYGIAAPEVVPVFWDDRDLANPIADVQDAVLSFRATGGGAPELWMNGFVATLWSQNQHVQRLIRGTGYIGQIGPQQVTDLLAPFMGLRRVVVYDEHWIPQNSNGTAGTPLPFISDEHVHLFCTSMIPGERMAEYASTPNMHNGGYENPRGGDYFFIDDHTMEPNPYLDVCAGFSGLPVWFHPEWTKVLKVYDSTNPWAPAA